MSKPEHYPLQQVDSGSSSSSLSLRSGAQELTSHLLLSSSSILRRLGERLLCPQTGDGGGWRSWVESEVAPPLGVELQAPPFLFSESCESVPAPHHPRRCCFLIRVSLHMPISVLCHSSPHATPEAPIHCLSQEFLTLTQTPPRNPLPATGYQPW